MTLPIPYLSALPASTKAADLPYQNQQGNGVVNDCGPAAALMLARWVGKGLNDSVAYWAKRIDVPSDGTTTQDLAGMLKALGLTPRIGADTPLPRLELVRYSKLPHQNPDYKGAGFLHWIVRLDETSYHDPLWTGTDGANLKATKAAIDAANIGFANSVGIAERPKEVTMSDKATVKAISWNVRTAPSTQAPIVGVLTKGDVVTFSGTARGENASWYVLPALAGGVPVKQSSDEKTPAVFYARVDGFVPQVIPAPVPQPEPAKPLAYSTPAHLLGVHELSGQGKAKKSLEMGAKAVMCFEDALGAAQLSLAYPDAVVFHRKDFRYPMPAADLLGAHGIDVNRVSNSRAWYRGANENDVATWDSDVESIRRRAKFDIECATLLRKAAPNAKWVAGGFAHGNPDFTDQRICDVIREVYAPAYNAGLIVFDIHTYSKSEPGKPKNYRYYGPIWFERRWEFLFTKCGFDPKVRGIVSTETGGECGAGGFNWAGFTPDEFRAWCAFYLKVSTQPLVVNGVTYPSPFLAATLFQWGNTYGGSGGWLGYALDNYIPTLQAVWAGQVPAEKSIEPIDVYAGEKPPADYVPPAKDIHERN